MYTMLNTMLKHRALLCYYTISPFVIVKSNVVKVVWWELKGNT